MAKSVKQLQDEILSSLDRMGESKASFAQLESLSAVEQLLVLSAANFILKVQDNLNRAGKIDTGTLAKDITSGDVIQTSTGYEVVVGYPANSKAAKYYDFVNKGVKGTRSGEPANSPYSFKTDYPSKDMTAAIAKWYRRHASAGRREDQRKNLSAVQRKRKKLSKMVDESKRLKSLAYATAVNIKRKGLKRTGFFDNAVDSSFGKDFMISVSKIVGKNLAVLIKSYGNNNK